MAMVDPGVPDAISEDSLPPYVSTAPHSAVREAACQTEEETPASVSTDDFPGTVGLAGNETDDNQSDYGDFEEGRDISSGIEEPEQEALLGPGQGGEEPVEDTAGAGPYGLLAGLLITMSNPHKL